MKQRERERLSEVKDGSSYDDCRTILHWLSVSSRPPWRRGQGLSSVHQHPVTYSDRSYFPGNLESVSALIKHITESEKSHLDEAREEKDKTEAEGEEGEEGCR